MFVVKDDVFRKEGRGREEGKGRKKINCFFGKEELVVFSWGERVK